jgi:hypothetical protein
MTQKRSKSRRAKAGKSREFCILHPDGHVSDAELHEPILQKSNDCQTREIGKEVGRRAGLPEAEISPCPQRAFDIGLVASGASNVVLLTSLGGGAFGNDESWIHAAM